MLPPLPYGPADHRRRVGLGGRVSFQGRRLRSETVAVRPTTVDGCWTVHFMTDHLATLDLRQPA